MKKILRNLQWYLELIWRTDKSCFLFFALQSLALAAAPAVGVLLPQVLLRDIMEGSFSVFAGDFAILCAASMTSSFLMVYYGFKKENLFTGLSFKLKEALQERTMTMPFTDLENPAVLNRMSSASGGVDRFVPAIHRAGTGILANGAVLIFYTILVSRLQPLLLLLPLLNMGISLYLENRTSRYEYNLRDEKAALARRKDYVFSLMYDYGYGKEIRLFTLGDWLKGIYRRWQKEYEQLLSRIAAKKTLSAGGDLLAALLREGAVYVFLILGCAEGELSIDAFVLYTGVFASFAALGQTLVRSGIDLADAARQIDSYRNFLAEACTAQATASTNSRIVPAKQGPWSVEFDRVSFRYPGSETYILKDFSCRIPAGAHVALVGNNGAGKTTIVKLLCGFYEDYEGTIRIDGTDLRQMDLAACREGIAAVFQESRVFPGTVLENITLQEANTPLEKEAAQKALRLTGLWEKIDSLSDKMDTPMTRAIEPSGVELSGGERQNLVICRALYKGGNILLLDEPTAALDALAEHRVYEQFHAIAQGRTTIFISHRLNSTRFCDQILLLKEGRVAEQGTHEELCRKKGDYEKLFQTQAKYYREGGSTE